MLCVFVYPPTIFVSTRFKSAPPYRNDFCTFAVSGGDRNHFCRGVLGATKVRNAPEVTDFTFVRPRWHYFLDKHKNGKCHLGSRNHAFRRQSVHFSFLYGYFFNKTQKCKVHVALVHFSKLSIPAFVWIFFQQKWFLSRGRPKVQKSFLYFGCFLIEMTFVGLPRLFFFN